MHQATCMQVSYTGYECSCKDGFEGTHCELISNPCDSNPCKNNAICEFDAFNTFNSTGKNFRCNCKPGFNGILCEINKIECVTVVNSQQVNVCGANGNCIDKVNGYQCVCDAGYTGTNCEINVDDCTSIRCENGSICIDKVNDVECICSSLFTGSRCEIEIDNCINNPCNFETSASCESYPNARGFRCICHEGYTGDTCLQGVFFKNSVVEMLTSKSLCFFTRLHF